MSENFDVEKIISYWKDSSDKDYGTMLHLYEAKDFHWSLFIGHIVIEKLLKAKVARVTNAHAPFTHDLLRLSQLSGLDLSSEQSDWLDTITTFNLNTRYDDYKQEFYLKCTPEFSAQWIERIKTLRTWIKKML
jgi:HEPN domain-containing protein